MRVSEPFEVSASGGKLAGWSSGSGDPVMLLHGGPGLTYNLVDELADELASEFTVATWQQRGLEPSTLQGPFTVVQAVLDAIAVLDGLEWERALVVGHSWGGHLALRLAAAHPNRLAGALAVDPLGVVGDGGMAAFEAELPARIAKEHRDRALELDERALAGQGTPDEALESLRLLWPAYFADPASAPPMPALRFCVDAYSGIIAQATADTEELAAALGRSDVPYGVLAGAASPIPWGQAARASSELSRHAFLALIPGAGHFPWLEVPGCVLAGLRRLQGAR